MQECNFFAGLQLDRRGDARPDWRAALSHPGTVYILSSGTRQLVLQGDEPRIAFLSIQDAIVQRAEEHQLILLGWAGDTPYVLLDIEPDTAAAHIPAPASFEELRSVADRMNAADAALLAYARALAIWRSRHRYCGVCASPTLPRSAGHVLGCTNPQCGHEQFPRLDPAIIVLVSDGERALLGRQASWPAGRYSTLAGFVEPGESLEEAVAREVMEETGVRVRDVLYRSSQPWPFPSSLMIGFHALAEPDAIRVGMELEDARWFTREDITLGRIQMPTSYSISHRLITEWLTSATSTD